MVWIFIWLDFIQFNSSDCTDPEDAVGDKNIEEFVLNTEALDKDNNNKLDKSTYN